VGVVRVGKGDIPGGGGKNERWLKRFGVGFLVNFLRGEPPGGGE